MIPTDYSLFIPVILTGLFAFFGTWAGSRFSHSNEHKQWLRNEKMGACNDFLAQIEGLMQVVSTSGDRRQLAEARSAASLLSLSKLSIVFSYEVVDSARKMKQVVTDVSNLAAEAAACPIEHREPWIEELTDALKKADRCYLEFIFEASRDLNSGRFYGSGMIAPLQMRMYRLRLKATEAT